MKNTNNHYRTTRISSEKVKSALQKHRNSLVLEIHRLQLIIKSCNIGIDNCLVKFLKSLAVLIKLKQNFISAHMVTLQDLLKKIDDSIDDPTISTTLKNKFIFQADEILTFRSQMTENNVEDFFQEDLGFIKNFENEVQLLELDSNEAVHAIERLFNERKDSAVSSTRKKYRVKTGGM